MKLTYRQTGLRMVPNAMFVVNDRLFAICRNQIWVASVSAPRLYFSFYSKLKSQDRIQDFLLGDGSELPEAKFIQLIRFGTSIKVLIHFPVSFLTIKTERCLHRFNWCDISDWSIQSCLAIHQSETTIWFYA